MSRGREGGCPRHVERNYVPLFGVAQSNVDLRYYVISRQIVIGTATSILSRHLVNGCVLKCDCPSLMLFLNLSCLGTIICYINTIGVFQVYNAKFVTLWARVVHDSQRPLRQNGRPHVKRPCDVALINGSV